MNCFRSYPIPGDVVKEVNDVLLPGRLPARNFQATTMAKG